ncbi:hypothetical protein [Luteimonas lutimaris]|uniref:STAS/SEC14 domain-containing protein n=1 Tax=Luteimonas lutimaris TaxID=698645 RepID=A0ABP7MBT9_9GAMM
MKTDYTIRITPHGDGMRAEVEGTSCMAATVAYWREIAGWARRHDARTLLLVDRLKGTPLTEAEWLRLVTSMHGEGLEKLRIAHVKPLGLGEVEFCEIFARDSGIEARVFENETLAEVWLRYGERGED